MANELEKDPMVIDTASPNVIITDRLRIKSIRWVYEGASAGDNVEVQDAAGNTIWETVASGANYSESELIEQDVTGLIILTLAGGKLYITLA